MNEIEFYFGKLQTDFFNEKSIDEVLVACQLLHCVVQILFLFNSCNNVVRKAIIRLQHFT